MECEVIERGKRSTLRWFGHIERMPGSEMAVYGSKVDVVARVRPPMKNRRTEC